MAMSSNVVGLDLGSHSLKAVEFRQTLRGFEAVAMRMLPRSDVDTPIAEQHLLRPGNCPDPEIEVEVLGEPVALLLDLPQ